MNRDPGTSASVSQTHGRWIETFVRNGALLMGGGLAQALIGLAGQIVLMRLLLPADFGEFALTFAAVSLVAVITSPRLGVLAIRARESEYTEAFRHRLNSAMAIEAGALLAVMAAWLILAGLAAPWSFVAAATVALGHWLGSVTCFFERSLPYRRLAAIETGSQAVGHVVGIGLAWAGAGVASLFLREAVFVVLRVALLAGIGAIPRWPLRRVTFAEWKAILKDARVPWLDGVVDGGFQRLTILAAGALTGVHGAGLFLQAQRLAMVPHQILSPVAVRLAGNIFSRIESGDDSRRAFGRIALVIGAPLAAAAVGAWVLANPVVPWVFGENWREAGPVLSAMSGVVLGFSLFELGRAYCVSQRRHALMIAGRLVQYTTFAAGCLALGDGTTATALGGVMSAVAVVSAGTVLLGLAPRREA